MPILNLTEMTSEDVKRLDRATTCVILIVSPVEEHGPHLPLGTDFILADAVARRLCERALARRPELTFLFHPAIPLGADPFRYPGSVDIRPATIRAVVEDIALSFAAHGFTQLMVSSHHGAPRHNLALEAAARAVERRSKARVLALSGRTIVDLYFERGLEAFFDRRGVPKERRRELYLDCHAGMFETSEMLAVRPELVRDAWRGLAPVFVPLEKLTQSSGATAAEGLGYFGAPAESSREAGEEYIDFVAERLLPDALGFLEGERVPGLALKWRLALLALTTWARVREALGPVSAGSRRGTRRAAGALRAGRG